MEVICLEDKAFRKLVEEVVNQVKIDIKVDSSPWVGSKKAKELLGIKSDTTFQDLRDEGKIIFSKPRPKIFMYNHDSILKYLEDSRVK